MSIKIMSMIFDRYPSGGGEMLLALALADHAQDDGTHVFPSVKSLSKKTRQSERTVQYQIRSMEELGWLILVADEKGGRGKAREYRINPEWIMGADIAPLLDDIKGATGDIKGATGDIKGATDDIKGAIAVAPESSITINESSITITNDLSEKKITKSILLSEYLDMCKQNNKKPIPEDDKVFDYADKVGLPYEYLKLGWIEFKKIHTDKTRKGGKAKQKDWRQKFRNYVEGGWLHIWWFDGEGKAALTTKGIQLQREVA